MIPSSPWNPKYMVWTRALNTCNIFVNKLNPAGRNKSNIYHPHPAAHSAFLSLHSAAANQTRKTHTFYHCPHSPAFLHRHPHETYHCSIPPLPRPRGHWSANCINCSASKPSLSSFSSLCEPRSVVPSVRSLAVHSATIHWTLYVLSVPLSTDSIPVSIQPESQNPQWGIHPASMPMADTNIFPSWPHREIHGFGIWFWAFLCFQRVVGPSAMCSHRPPGSRAFSPIPPFPPKQHSVPIAICHLNHWWNCRMQRTPCCSDKFDVVPLQYAVYTVNQRVYSMYSPSINIVDCTFKTKLYSNHCIHQNSRDTAYFLHRGASLEWQHHLHSPSILIGAAPDLRTAILDNRRHIDRWYGITGALCTL